MKKSIVVMMFVVGALAMAGQSGLAQYRYTQGNYSLTVVDRAEFDALGTAYDMEVAFMEHRGGADVATGQAGYDDYLYSQRGGYTDVDDDLATRMSRGSTMPEMVTGQPGYDEYKYTQGSYSSVAPR